MNVRRNWDEKETLIALALFYAVPFGKITSGNSLLQKVARELGRTTGALVMKMCNLARFDQKLHDRNVSGLLHGSKMDKKVWDKFGQDYALLANIYDELCTDSHFAENDFLINETIGTVNTGYDTERTVKERVGQNFFRTAVLSAYDYRCCITGINVPEFLIASHIKPWAKSEDYTEKINPSNGLCLNALHDRAFDQGFITVDKYFRIVVSDVLKKNRKVDEKTKEWLMAFEGEKISLPDRCQPDLKFLEYHNDVIFRR